MVVRPPCAYSSAPTTMGLSTSDSESPVPRAHQVVDARSTMLPTSAHPPQLVS